MKMEVSENTLHEAHRLYFRRKLKTRRKFSQEKKRRLSAADGFNKINKALEAFMNYRQEAYRRFGEADEERERREREKGTRNEEWKISSFSAN